MAGGSDLDEVGGDVWEVSDVFDFFGDFAGAVGEFVVVFEWFDVSVAVAVEAGSCSGADDFFLSAGDVGGQVVGVVVVGVLSGEAAVSGCLVGVFAVYVEVFVVERVAWAGGEVVYVGSIGTVLQFAGFGAVGVFLVVGGVVGVA